mmetsp:Transcript_12226/g.30434  ORF Transcript_12226/g.30434 Transcript_12226/m.30434 type:complete len:301 (+) Transcript_12226:1667-2569(+)
MVEVRHNPAAFYQRNTNILHLGARGSAGLTATWPEGCTRNKDLPDLRYLMRAGDAGCIEVRLTFAFTPSAFATANKLKLPLIPSSPCNIAFTDNRTVFPAGNGWRIRRIEQWPWPSDPFRSTHVIKVVAPLLFPHAKSILWGDVKCVDAAHRFPCAALRARSETDLHVPMNAWYRSRSIEGEFVATWQHMRARRQIMQAHVFEDITRELCAQERVKEYDLRRIYRMPDILCMGWRQTSASRAFACEWAFHVATLSMREQLSFDVSRPVNISISMGKQPHFGRFPPSQSDWGCNDHDQSHG